MRANRVLVATSAVGSLLALTLGCQSPTQPEFASCDERLAALQGPFPGVFGMGISFDGRGREFVFLVYSNARLPCPRGVPARLEGVRVFLVPGDPPVVL